MGAALGKTTGWIHRSSLQKRGVQFINGVDYQHIDDLGLHIKKDEKSQILKVDNIIICAGQLPQRELESALRSANISTYLIGGADKALELDAKHAIEQGTRLALQI
jgi:2,4-dienoyl-CoA reductase (NADPH2)